MLFSFLKGCKSHILWSCWEKCGKPYCYVAIFLQHVEPCRVGVLWQHDSKCRRTCFESGKSKINFFEYFLIFLDILRSSDSRFVLKILVANHLPMNLPWLSFITFVIDLISSWREGNSKRFMGRVPAIKTFESSSSYLRN